MEFICKNCGKIYKSNVGLWKHNKKCVEPVVEDKKYPCAYCNKQLGSRQARWTHGKNCTKKKEFTNINETVKELQLQVQELKAKPTTQNIVNGNNNVINYTQNIIISNTPGNEPIDYLTIEQKKFIMNKGLSSLMYLIETTNFNKEKPENHSYCVTAINDKHASMIDCKTNSVIKADKMELYDKVLAGNLNKLEKLSDDHEFKPEEKAKYKEVVERIKNVLFKGKRGNKKYYSEINLLSYNNKELVQETWNGLKKLDEMVMTNDKSNIITCPTKTQLINQSDYSDSELSESDNDLEESVSEDESIDYNENEGVSIIIIKGKECILENDKVYLKNPDGSKGKFYFNLPKEIDL